MSSTPNHPADKNVLVLRPRNPGRFAHTVYQEDLEELLLLSRYFSEARDRWEAKRTEIRAALETGARVENGVHTAELVQLGPADYAVKRASTLRLVVR